MDGYKQKNAYIGTQGTNTTVTFHNEPRVGCLDEIGFSSAGLIVAQQANQPIEREHCLSIVCSM
jgi:hypothetical protein